MGVAFAKGFSRAMFWVKLGFWRGAVRGEVFFAKFGVNFLAKFYGAKSWAKFFQAILLGNSEQKHLSKNSSPKFPRLCTAKLEKTQGTKLHDEVLQGDPCQLWPKYKKSVGFSIFQGVLVSSIHFITQFRSPEPSSDPCFLWCKGPSAFSASSLYGLEPLSLKI